MKKVVVALVSFLLFYTGGNSLLAQGNVIRGTVVDFASGSPLISASVVVLNIQPWVGASTNNEGGFVLPSLSVGRYDIQVSCLGYETVTHREVMVSSAKETFLNISLRENVQQLDEIVIRSTVNKDKPLNTMATVGARMLSVDESSRYAGGFDDPARLVTAFAGVTGNVRSNGIAIRGNSPQFLQWRLEGLEMPNPTHFSNVLGVGGGILTALSSQVLDNSDFMTGAFPAEYGNALSGVFDMQLRSGNNYQREHTVQIGPLGLEYASEGPFVKGGKASYLFNYRYSSVATIGKLLPDLAGEAAGMRYQDLSFKLNFPTRKAGTFSVWGISILDKFVRTPPEDVEEWENNNKGWGDSRQTKLMGGIGHKLLFANGYWKTSLGANLTKEKMIFEHWGVDGSKYPTIDFDESNWKFILNSFINKKFSASHVNRTGITVTSMLYDLDYYMSPDVEIFPPDPMRNIARSKGNSMLLSAYSQSTLRFGERWNVNVGLHAQHFLLNKQTTLEPRVGVKWQLAPGHSFGAAYGLHSRHEKLDYYFIRINDEYVNQKLKLGKAHHLSFGYDWAISNNLHLKIEPYYQYLYDIAVMRDGVGSIINYQNFYLMEALTGKGKGKNYGIELTFERYLNKGYYYMFTGSLFRSLYSGGNGEWHSTRLDRKFLFNLLGGREWTLGKKKDKLLSVNLRLSYQGGERYTPFDIEASQEAEKVIYDNSNVYGKHYNPVLLVHFTASYKIYKRKLAHEFAIKMINATGVKEWGDPYYNYYDNKPVVYRIAISIPNIYYKIEF